MWSLQPDSHIHIGKLQNLFVYAHGVFTCQALILSEMCSSFSLGRYNQASPCIIDSGGILISRNNSSALHGNLTGRYFWDWIGFGVFIGLSHFPDLLFH